ncbi:MAG: hypothetical protein NUV69_02150 [Candidatus Curtissbacteria bacterium]|nr:hypothetical protein [Candidatus Curtissbacteria bacterium]
MIGIRKLLWDAWNTAHIARHNVTPDEVEQICHADPVVQIGKKGRLLVFGPTDSGKILAVILDKEEEKNVYYPVTAYKASKKLIRIYLNQKGGEQK